MSILYLLKLNLGGFTLPDTIKELVDLAQAKSVLNPNTEREGIVIRSTDASVSMVFILNTSL